MIAWDNLLDYYEPETAWFNLKILYLTKLMTTFPSLLLRVNINLFGLIPSATPNVKQKTNYIKLLSRRKPLSLN